MHSFSLSVYTYLILRYSFFLPSSLVFFFPLFPLSFLVWLHVIHYIFHRCSLFFHPFLRSSFSLFTVFCLFPPKKLFIMPRSLAKTPLTIRLTSGWGRPAAIKTTNRSIRELSTVTAFVQARIRSPLTKCENRCCARRFHPRTHLCYATESFHSPECQEIMVALQDNTLLDCRTTYPFLLVVDVALYLLLEKDYF